MKNRIDLNIFILVFAVWAAAAAPDRAHAQEAPAGETSITNKLSGEFVTFLGEDNSTNVVTGLRNGSSFEYTDKTGTTVTVEPPAGKMGYGEVSHSLLLAEYKLAQDGITDPTAPQFQEALTGEGGILTLRESGMGWGQIAQEMDTTLGAIISKGKAAQQALNSGKTFTSETSGAGSESSVGATATTSGSGIVTGRGKAWGLSKGSEGSGIVTGGGKSSGNGIVTGSGSSSGDGYGSGIVSGSGKSFGHSSGGVYGSGIVGGSGRSFGSGGGGRSFGGTRGRGR